MIRRTVTWSVRGLAILSLLLATGVAIVWLLSWSNLTQWEVTLHNVRDQSSADLEGFVSRDVCVIQWIAEGYDFEEGMVWSGLRPSSVNVRSAQRAAWEDPYYFWINRFGFGHYSSTRVKWTKEKRQGTVHYTSHVERKVLRVAVPPLLVILVMGLPAGIYLYRVGRTMIRGRRRKQGCCEHCGYDLRATPERCPECGNMPEHITRSGAGSG